MNKTLWAAALLLVLAWPAQAQETTLRGEPFGYVRVNVAAGTGTAKRTSFISIPLIEEASINGAVSGRITAIGTNSITAAGAGWTAGQLSTAATPHLIEITSGVARGRMFLISTTTANANTADTVIVDRVESTRISDLRSIGILTGAETGDTYRIRAVDTLSSLFGSGTEQNPVVSFGAETPTAADTIKLSVNGSTSTYYYSTSRGRWTLVGLGSPDASNTPIPPYAGMQYERLPNTPLSFLVTGRVPTTPRQAVVKNSGTTILSSHWPVARTFASLGLQNLSGWMKGASNAVADTVIVSTSGSSSTYYHDGANWRRVFTGAPLANNDVIPLGASLMINKKGTAGGFSFYRESAPYTLP